MTEINRTGIRLGDTSLEEIGTISKKLGEVEFETISPDGTVSVWMAGNGNLRDVVIADDAFARFDAQEMSTILTSVLSEAETTVREVLESLQAEALERSK